MDTWWGIIVVGAGVGLVYSFVPMFWRLYVLLKFSKYADFDLIRAGRIVETDDFAGLALPLTQKLTEKGILLSWKSQRALERLRTMCEQGGYPFPSEDFDSLKTSLETYRTSVGMLSDRVDVMAWHHGMEFGGPVPPFVRSTFDGIDRDWREFRKYSELLRRFVTYHCNVRTVHL